MKAIERIEQRWLRDEDLQNLTVDQAKTVIDTLALVMFADMETDATEEAAYDTLTMTLPFGWGEIAELISHSAQASRKAATCSTAEIQSQIEAAAAAVPEHVRTQVMGMIIAVAVSDKELKDAEAQVLSHFSAAFGFDKAKAQSIYQDTLDAMGLE